MKSKIVNKSSQSLNRIFISARGLLQLFVGSINKKLLQEQFPEHRDTKHVKGDSVKVNFDLKFSINYQNILEALLWLFVSLYIHQNVLMQPIICVRGDVCRPKCFFITSEFLRFSEVLIFKKIINVTYSSPRSHTGQLNLCNWLADGNTTG